MECGDGQQQNDKAGLFVLKHSCEGFQGRSIESMNLLASSREQNKIKNLQTLKNLKALVGPAQAQPLLYPGPCAFWAPRCPQEASGWRAYPAPPLLKGP